MDLHYLCVPLRSDASLGTDDSTFCPGKQSGDELARVWWFTSGFLTFLPIHAAGIYGEEAFPGSKLSDFVVSSYAPTLSSIITDSCSTTLPNRQVLAVALPVESRLPGTWQELDCIVNRVGSPNVEKLVESEASLENVVAGLKKSSFVHFACHGVQDPTNPNQSALLLAKSSRLTLSHLYQLSLPHAQLAFLSACQTAAGDETLVQESVHLAAGMLSAGYRGVIATMWSIRDSDAPVVADEVYGQLFKDSDPDPTEAARALDKAVKKLIKDSSGTKSCLEWVPFIHIGI
jgi:CHAT domain-containing protein